MDNNIQDGNDDVATRSIPGVQHSSKFRVVEGGRNEIENRLVETFFTPYNPDNTSIGQALAEQLKPRLNARDVTLFSQEPPRR